METLRESERNRDRQTTSTLLPLLYTAPHTMSTKSGHDLDHSGGGKHHHGDGHGKHHHGDGHGKHHHGDHHGHHKHPPLREAVMKAGKGDGASSHGAAGHSPPHGRPRAGTLTRRDTVMMIMVKTIVMIMMILCDG